MSAAPKLLTVLIPTFNRRALLMESIASALPLLEMTDTEILVVDDASKDGTVEALHAAFPELLRTGHLRILSNATNLGVTGARNAGVPQALGEWLVLLDSDDLLRREGLPAMVGELRGTEAPVVFFRCVNVDGQLLGRAEKGNRRITPADLLLTWAWGECLPVIRRSACLRFPYDVDLKGVEGLTYCRMTRALGPAMLSTLAVRTYREDGLDRLSSKAGVQRRACELARGHQRILTEFWRDLGVMGTARQIAKVAYYNARCLQMRARAAGQTGGTC